MPLTVLVLGLIVFTWVVSAGINYTGTWYSDYLPVSDSNRYVLGTTLQTFVLTGF